MRTAKSSPLGFTLLEILVALAIVSIVILGYLRSNSVMIANAEYLRQKTLAHWVAMNRTAYIRLTGQWLTGDSNEGIDLMGDRRWSWKATGRISPDPDVQIITVEVRPADRETASPLDTMTMFLARPSALGGSPGGAP